MPRFPVVPAAAVVAAFAAGHLMASPGLHKRPERAPAPPGHPAPTRAARQLAPIRPGQRAAAVARHFDLERATWRGVGTSRCAVASGPDGWGASFCPPPGTILRVGGPDRGGHR